jgi:hypothetical protein
MCCKKVGWLPRRALGGRDFQDGASDRASKPVIPTQKSYRNSTSTDTNTLSSFAILYSAFNQAEYSKKSIDTTEHPGNARILTSKPPQQSKWGENPQKPSAGINTARPTRTHDQKTAEQI